MVIVRQHRENRSQKDYWVYSFDAVDKQVILTGWKGSAKEFVDYAAATAYQ